MNILVFNCGSSSLKFRLYAMPEEEELLGGEVQRIGSRTREAPVMAYRRSGQRQQREGDWQDHAAAFTAIRDLLRKEAFAIDAMGHRVVHGGSRFQQATILGRRELDELATLDYLAPIHNPPATRLIEACLAEDQPLPQVGVFDTAFHRTIPDAAYTYALPREYRVGFGLRKYGFHGTSHQFVVEEAARILGCGISGFDGVSCHLGSGGASLCAVRKGCSIDNTMGYSPLQGLIMSTRCGDMPSTSVLRMLAGCVNQAGEVEKLLNQHSGILGMSGLSSDIRDVISAVHDGTGDARCTRTVDAYIWRLRTYLGAYLALVGNARAVIFTDTIGERVPFVRQAVCEGLLPFGVAVDAEANAACIDRVGDISAASSTCRVLVIPTNEELTIARDVYRLRLQEGN